MLDSVESAAMGPASTATPQNAAVSAGTYRRAASQEIKTSRCRCGSRGHKALTPVHSNSFAIPSISATKYLKIVKAF